MGAILGRLLLLRLATFAIIVTGTTAAADAGIWGFGDVQYLSMDGYQYKLNVFVNGAPTGGGQFYNPQVYVPAIDMYSAYIVLGVHTANGEADIVLGKVYRRPGTSWTWTYVQDIYPVWYP